MIIRRFRETDRDQVEKMISNAGQRDLPRGGLGVVAERDDKVIGFVWALTGDSDTAFVDFFVVHESVRSTGFTAMAVMQRMMVELIAKKVTKVVGIVHRHQPGVESLLKYYTSAGMEANDSHVLTGDPTGILKWMTKRRAA